MQVKPSKRQLQALKAIYDSLRDSGYPPTLSDLREVLSVSSNQAILDLLKALESKGLIKKEEGMTRGIRIQKNGFRVLDVTPISPYVGASAAGPYTEAFEDVQWKPVGQIEELDDILIRVKGDSMVGAGIENGDVVVIRKSKEFRNGDIVLARSNDGTTIKRLIHEEGKVYL